MTDKVKVSKWFDEWIKNNKKDKNKGALIACISPCAYHDKYFEYRINNDQFIEKQYLEIRENFEDYVRAILDGYEVEEEKTPLGWTPEKGEKYWQVLSNGKAFSYRNDREVDIDIFKYTRVFKTKEEAEFEKERIKVTRELEKYAREFKRGGFNYYIYVDRVDRTETAINFSCRETIQWQGLCFESVKKAKEAIKAVGEDRILKYYFGVENE